MDRSSLLTAAAGVSAGSGALGILIGASGTPAFLVLGVVLVAFAGVLWRRANARAVDEAWDDVASDAVGPGGAAGNDSGHEAAGDQWTWTDADETDGFWGDDAQDPWSEPRTREPEAARRDRGAWHERVHPGREERRERTRRRDAGGRAKAGDTEGQPAGNGRGPGNERSRAGDPRASDARAGDAESGRRSRHDGDTGDTGAGGSQRTDGTDVGPRDHVGPRLRSAYETLGLEPGASQDAIRAAYRDRIKAAHPDTPGGSAEEFKRVRDAYETLSGR